VDQAADMEEEADAVEGRITNRPIATSFKGSTAEMNGNVFECYDEQTDRRQCTKTVEALESHNKKMCKSSEDLTPLFATESCLPVLAASPKPVKTADGRESDEVDIELWKKR
jgi:hypothetical protein